MVGLYNILIFHNIELVYEHCNNNYFFNDTFKYLL